MAGVLLQTDLVDSTAIAERLGDADAARLWEQHDQAARDLLREWRGREIDKSDGFLLLFADVADAIGYALAYHQALRTLAPPLTARAGVHCGALTLRENRADDIAGGAKPMEIDGLAKPITARIMTLAQAGQTLLSAQARADLPPDARWRVVSHGHWRLKGVNEPVELFEAGEATAPFAPPPDAPKAWRVAWRGDAWLPVAEFRNNLPAERDTFVGRRAALQDLARRFDNDHARLVSVLGVGGTGKTRLALRYARSWIGDFPGGAWFCDLSQARSLDGIVHAVAQGLDVPLGKADPVLQLGAAIAGRGPCLMVLDNFEQVVTHAEATIGRWLEQAAEARFLVTTREVLGIAGEQTIGLDPLPTDEAVDLFERRAAACDSYRPTPEDELAVPALVTLMDGLPLAIELAAPRVRVMPPRVLLQRMSERFKLLASTGGRRDRQATLRATLDWSWELLSDPERSTLAQLSVFEGGFTLEAVEAVVDLSAYDAPPWVGDLLQQLVEKSLVYPRSANRFDLLLSVRAYAAQQLSDARAFAASGPMAQSAARRGHWTYFAGLDQQAVTADRCAELDNLVTACQHAASQQQADAAVSALTLAWVALKLTGPFTAALQLVDQVAATGKLDDRQQAALHWVAGSACARLGRVSEAIGHCEHGLGLAASAGDLRLQVRLHCVMADVKMHSAEPVGARGHLDQAQPMAARLGDDQLSHLVLNLMGTLAFRLSRFDQAQSAYGQALEIARRLGLRREEGGLLGNLSIVAYSLGRFEEATALNRSALEAAEEVGDRLWIANTRCNLGQMLCERGELESSLAESVQALSTARDLGTARLEAAVLCNIGLVHQARSAHDLAREHFDAASRIASRLGDLRLQAQIRRHIGKAMMLAQRLEAATAELEAALGLAQQVQDGTEVILLRCELARALALRGAAHAADRELNLAVEALRSADPAVCKILEAAVADARAVCALQQRPA